MFQKRSPCFTKQIIYVGNIPSRSYTINKITFIIINITIIIIIIIIIIIFKFNITIITIMIKSTIITIVLSFVLHFFNIRVPHHIWIYLCFFLTTCFLLFVGFRCNILLSNISIDLLLLLASFFWKILVLSINDFQNLSCALT